MTQQAAQSWIQCMHMTQSQLGWSFEFEKLGESESGQMVFEKAKWAYSAKHGGAYFSAIYRSIQDPIAAPGLFDIQVP